jgi:hypothetical protein
LISTFLPLINKQNSKQLLVLKTGSNIPTIDRVLRTALMVSSDFAMRNVAAIDSLTTSSGNSNGNLIIIFVPLFSLVSCA